MTTASENDAVVHFLKNYIPARMISYQGHKIRNQSREATIIISSFFIRTDLYPYCAGHSSSRVTTDSAGMAISSALEPSVLYPLKTTGFTDLGLSKVLTIL